MKKSRRIPAKAPRANESDRRSQPRQGQEDSPVDLAILDALPEHFALLNNEGVIVAVNEAWRRFARANLLASPAHGVGLNYLHVCESATGELAAEAAAVAAGIRAVLRGERDEFAIEYPCHAPDTKRWFRLTVSPLARRASLGAVVMHADITERRLAEEALRASEQNFRRIVQDAAIGIAITDVDARFLEANAAYCRMLGYTEAELRRMRVPELTHPDDRERDVELLRSLSAGHRPSYVVEKRYLVRGGRVVWGRVSVSAQFDAEGKPVRFIGMAEDITEYKVATEALQRSEERFRELAENVGDVFYNYDPVENRLLYVNHAYEEIWGRPLDPLHADPTLYLDYVHSEDREAAAEAFRRQQTGQVTDVDFRVVRPDGDVVWIHEHAVPILDADGKVARIVGTMRDITERKAALARVRESEERFRLLSRATNDAIWDWDPVTNDLWWNEGFATLFGYDPDQVEPTFDLWSAALHPDDRDRVLHGVREALAGTAQTFANEYRLRRADGTYAYVLDRGHIIRGAAGEPRRAIGGVTDLTQRRRAEEKLREQAALLDKAQDAILVRDLEHRVLYWNRGAERIYGWTADEATGRSIQELLYRDPAPFHAATQATLDHGEWSGEITHSTKAGQAIVVEARWTLVRDEAGAPKSILAINTDVTERKQLEQQFLRVQRMESIGTLASGIAHDLNNILAPILMSVGVLRREQTSPAAREMLDTLQSCAQRGADLVQQVLAFARGVEGRRMTVNPVHLLRDIQKIVRETFPKNIAVRFSLPRELGTMQGDPTQLHQVLMNLCVNARDAMVEGGTLRLALEAVDVDEVFAGMHPDAQPGRYLVISVADTGRGIPPEIRERIFEPFFTTKELGRGTGLGLSTTLGIVRSHGGFIHLYSELGRGTTFKVYLPVTPTADVPAPTAAGDESLPPGQGETLLLVDDEEAVRTIAQRSLERFGYRVITAANGAEAVALYAQRRAEIAVVLTDMAMPVMDGPATILALKALNPEIRIIGSSGLASREGMARAMSAGVRHFIPKPYSAETMLRILRDVLADPR